MLTMASLTRDAAAVRRQLRVEEDKSVWCKKGCSIYIPKRLMGTALLRPDTIPTQVGTFFMLVIGDKYLVFNACTVAELDDAEMQTVLVDDEECLEFTFEQDSRVIISLEVPLVNSLGYDITGAFGKKGIKIPWYTHTDHLSILHTLREFTGLRTPALPYIDIYMNHLMRSSKDLTIPYRLVKDKANTPYSLIGIHLVGLTVDNTLSALGGSYMDDAIQGKLVNASTRVNSMEKVLTA